MKRIVVTGATGLIGSHLIARMLRESVMGYDIVAVAANRNSFSKLDYVLRYYGIREGRYRPVVGSLEYIEDCRRAVNAEGVWEVPPDIVYHCAARVAIGSPREGEKVVTDNVEMTHNMLTAVREILTPERDKTLFAHISSVAALGNTRNRHGQVDEDSVMEDLEHASPYARSKFLSENEVWRAAAHGLPVVVVNTSVVVGISAPESGFWLRGLIKGIRRGLPLWPAGGSAFVSAEDVARALMRLAEKPEAYGRRYLLSAENISYLHLLTLLAAANGRREPRIKVPRWVLRIVRPLFPPVSALLDTQHPKEYDASKITRTVDFEYSSLVQTFLQIVQDCK